MTPYEFYCGVDNPTHHSGVWESDQNSQVVNCKARVPYGCVTTQLTSDVHGSRAQIEQGVILSAFGDRIE